MFLQEYQSNSAQNIIFIHIKLLIIQLYFRMNTWYAEHCEFFLSSFAEKKEIVESWCHCPVRVFVFVYFCWVVEILMPLCCLFICISLFMYLCSCICVFPLSFVVKDCGTVIPLCWPQPHFKSLISACKGRWENLKEELR